MTEPNPPASQDPAQPNATPGEGDAPVREVQNATSDEIAQFVTTIKNAEIQVGEHIIQALQHGNTVAVLTSVVLSPGGQQHVVSAALDARQAALVNQLLAQAQKQRKDETLCVGFHCLINPKDETAQSSAVDPGPTPDPNPPGPATS